VARLGIQTAELVQWVEVDEKARSDLVSTYLDLQRRLLGCFETLERLRKSHDAAIEESGRDTAVGNRSLPYLIGLQEDSESFLLASKNYLRELVRVINIAFDAKMEIDSAVFWDKSGSSESKLYRWAETRFGAENSLSKMLRRDSQWIAELVRMRNAVEHPGGKSGTLIFRNFEQHGPKVMPPSWQREPNETSHRSPVISDIEVAVSNLLELAEDLLAEAVMKTAKWDQITIAEIPESNRDPSAPVRLAVVPKFAFRYD
jgi:hypothetical protein